MRTTTISKKSDRKAIKAMAGQFKKGDAAFAKKVADEKKAKKGIEAYVIPQGLPPAAGAKPKAPKAPAAPKAPKKERAPKAPAAPAAAPAPAAAAPRVVPPEIAKAAKKFKALEIKPGFIVLTEFSKKGGVRFEREEIRQEAYKKVGEEREWKSVKRVDNVEVFNGSRSLVSSAYYAMDRGAAITPLGYYVAEAELPALLDKVREVQAEVAKFNADAAAAKSERRVTVEVYPLEVKLDNAAVVGRIARSVRERLAALLDALREGNRQDFETAWENCRNLEHLATGMQRSSIEFGLEAAKAAKALLLEELREQAEKAGKKPKDLSADDRAAAARRVPASEIEALEAAIDVFTPPAGA